MEAFISRRGGWHSEGPRGICFPVAKVGDSWCRKRICVAVVWMQSKSRSKLIVVGPEISFGAEQFGGASHDVRRASVDASRLFSRHQQSNAVQSRGSGAVVQSQQASAASTAFPIPDPGATEPDFPRVSTVTPRNCISERFTYRPTVFHIAIEWA